jgi:hypothetical protein
VKRFAPQLPPIQEPSMLAPMQEVSMELFVLAVVVVVVLFVVVG